MARNMPNLAGGSTPSKPENEVHYCDDSESLLSSTVDNGGPKLGSPEPWAECLVGYSHEPHKSEPPSQLVPRTNLDRANKHEQQPSFFSSQGTRSLSFGTPFVRDNEDPSLISITQ